MKIGIMTGGGDCPGLNAVIRGVIRASLTNYHWEVIGFLNGYKGLIENKFKILTFEADAGLIQRGGTIIGTSNRDNPFKYSEVVNGKRIVHDVSGRVVDNYRKNGLEAVVVVGGDGTLSTALQLSKMGMNIVGVPKTIDNDLSATDYTFGFDTAVSIVTDAIDRLKTTAESHDRVMVVEVMGRDAGWIALFSGIAGAANIILIPEIPYDIDMVCRKIYERKAEGKHSSIVVVAEGAKPIGGEVTVKRVVDDPTTGVRLGGIGSVVGDQIEAITHIETRVAVLGHIQRGGKPSAFDRILCTRLGVEAVEMIRRKDFGKMACLKTPNIETVPLEQASVSKNVDPNGPLVKTAKSIGVSFGV